MALTEYQRSVCRSIAQHRILSRDVDLFHDTAAAVEASFEADRVLLLRSGYDVLVTRQRQAFVEAEVVRGLDSVLLQWVQDSAFRFFPLLEHPEFGLVLHPVDLATNKVLALIGRVEVRDWVDAITASEQLQPLGCLAWAAVGKDPGFSPRSVLEHAARGNRYSAVEVASLAFDGTPPDAGDLSRRWHSALEDAREVVGLLPPDTAGQCVLDRAGGLLRGSPAAVSEALKAGRVVFHAGSIRGAWPQLVS